MINGETYNRSLWETQRIIGDDRDVGSVYDTDDDYKDPQSPGH